MQQPVPTSPTLLTNGIPSFISNSVSISNEIRSSATIYITLEKKNKSKLCEKYFSSFKNHFSISVLAKFAFNSSDKNVGLSLCSWVKKSVFRHKITSFEIRVESVLVIFIGAHVSDYLEKLLYQFHPWIYCKFGEFLFIISRVSINVE